MSILLILVGLVLLLAGSTWFAGAATVGLIALIAGGVLLVVQVIWGMFVANKVRKTFKEVDRGFSGRF